MKNQATLALATASLLAAASVILAADTRLILYPAPSGEELSKDYQITINGRSLDVYQARVNDPPWNDPKRGFDAGGPYSFGSFDFSGNVEIVIQSPARPLAKVVVRGQGRKLTPQPLGPNTIKISLDHPEKLSIEPDGKQRPLYLFANPLEKNAPTKGDAGVIFFGPGVHRLDNGLLNLSSGQTLYLAGGAVVQGAVHAADAENIRICGRGILCGNPWEWGKGQGHVISLNNCKNVSIEGIVIRGAWAWTIVPSGCEGVEIQNVKLCNGRVLNDDGINPCNSRRVSIRNCFIRTMDDCVALKGLNATLGDVDGITVENSLLWCDSARITLLGHESRAARMRNIVYRNLEIVHHGHWPVFLLEVSDGMALSNVRFEDIRITGDGQPNLATIRPHITQYSKEKTWGSIDGVTFRNINVEGKAGKYVVMLDCAPNHGNFRIKNIAFENFRILDEVLNSQSMRLVLGCWMAKPDRFQITFTP